MKLAILGSCATRDAFEHLPAGRHALVLYAARTSFVSLAAPPLDVPEEAIPLGPFQRRMVHWDLTKQFWRGLEAAAPDALVVDFIDERFDLLQFGGSLCTKSDYLVQSGLPEKRLAAHETILRSHAHGLWHQACPKVARRLRRICPRVILHQALWASRRGDAAGVRPMDAVRAGIAEGVNLWMKEYFAAFIRAVPNATCISVDERRRYADPAHKWGPSHFHYGPEYYQEFANRLDAALASGAAASYTDFPPEK